MTRPVLVSACLVGHRCRYDDRIVERPEVGEALADRRIVAVCPEMLGELGIPRMSADLNGGDGDAVWRGEARVLRSDGVDVTAAFRRGAELALAAAPDADLAVLKARSPSCGVHQVTIDGELQPGMGVLAALLTSRGIPLVEDGEIEEYGLRRRL